MALQNPAPGWPGIPARWTSSAKSGVGTAPSARSRVWYTLSHGILNEIYYPRIDHACTRDFGLIVTDGTSFFSEEKRDTRSEIRAIDDGVPAFAVSSACSSGRYRLEKLVLSDPARDVLLQRLRFRPLVGKASDYRLYALPDGKRPGLVGCAGADGAIEVEIWDVPTGNVGALLAGIAPPLGLGTVILESGERVCGFLCEGARLAGARDITAYGGWRAWRSAGDG